jgi:hypothetical protein
MLRSTFACPMTRNNIRLTTKRLQSRSMPLAMLHESENLRGYWKERSCGEASHSFTGTSKGCSVFPPIVDEVTFRRAQAGLPRPRRWSDEEIIKRIRRLLKAKGRLSETLLQKTRGCRQRLRFTTASVHTDRSTSESVIA